MALYAFDGTWNEDEHFDQEETNVRKFLQAYQGANFKENYIEGVGTRFGTLGKVFGGVFGMGGKTRIEEMYEKLVNHWNAGDHEIDIIGFSRGAALAVHFANLIAKHGVKYNDHHVMPDIRFLGVWDIVGSFGVPINFVLKFHDVNIGYNISSVSDKVQKCYHAMAIHELRQTFAPTRLDLGNNQPYIQETWFRGVHSDIGGGNKNTELSNIPLAWMLQQAIGSGLPIDTDKIISYNTGQNASAPLGENFDIIRSKMRLIHPSDDIHESARGNLLKSNETAEFTVGSKEKYSWTGVRVEAGAHYSFSIALEEKWKDSTIECSTEGWRTEELPWYKEELFELMEYKRRCSHANWFELMGSVGDDGSEIFRIGKGGDHATYTPQTNGLLYAFANDIKQMYFNNHGQVKVLITRNKTPGEKQLSFFKGS